MDQTSFIKWVHNLCQRAADAALLLCRWDENEEEGEKNTWFFYAIQYALYLFSH